MPKCHFCPSLEGEQISASVSFIAGVPMESVRTSACAHHTSQGFGRIAELLIQNAKDVPRRRAILELNTEYGQLKAKGAPDIEITANRAEKTALVMMQKVDAVALAKAAQRILRPGVT